MCHSGATLDPEMRRPGELANNTNTRGFPQVWTPLQKKQDARAFKYMSEATINTNYFIWKLFIHFFLGGEGGRGGRSKLKSGEKRLFRMV